MEKEVFEKMMEKACQDYIEDYDFSYLVRDIISSKMTDKVDKYIEERINEEINKVLETPVHTNDGWGHKEDYNSFEELFIKKFAEKMDGDWEMQSTIRRTVEDRISELMKKKTKEVTTKIQDMLLKEIVKEEE